jgi:hypothetical protein
MLDPLIAEALWVASVVFVVIGFLGIIFAVAMVANLVAASIRLAARQPRSPRTCSSASASSRSASNERVDPLLHGPAAEDGRLDVDEGETTQGP